MTETEQAPPHSLIDLTADIVSAYIANNNVPVTELPSLISGIHTALATLGSQAYPEPAAVEKLTSTQIRKSIMPDALISFEDGKSYKTLRRHLTLRGLSPEAYREKWGLPRDYPMTAASYSAQRSELARSLGLGQQRRKAATKAANVTDQVADAPKLTRGRPRKAAAAPVAPQARGRRKAAAVAAE